MAPAKKETVEEEGELPSDAGLLRDVVYDPWNETRLRPSRPGDYVPVNVDVYVFQRAAQEIAALGVVPPGLRAAQKACLAFVKALPGERRIVQSNAEFMRHFMDLCRTVVARLQASTAAERRAVTSPFLAKHHEARDVYERLIHLNGPPVKPEQATVLLISCFVIAYLSVRSEGSRARVESMREAVPALLRIRPVLSARELALQLVRALGLTARESEKLFSSVRTDETRARKKKSKGSKTLEKRRRDTPP